MADRPQHLPGSGWARPVLTALEPPSATLGLLSHLRSPQLHFFLDFGFNFCTLVARTGFEGLSPATTKKSSQG